MADQFEATEDPIRHGMATVMLSFPCRWPFSSARRSSEAIRDNLDLDAGFALLKSHERPDPRSSPRGDSLVLGQDADVG